MNGYVTLVRCKDCGQLAKDIRTGTCTECALTASRGTRARTTAATGDHPGNVAGGGVRGGLRRIP